MTITNVKNKNDLSCLLEPSSIAVIGASNDSNKISGRPIEYLLRYGFGGEIYPVNPKYEFIQGLPAYGSIDDLPNNVDLAIIAIAAANVIDCLKACIKKNVKSCMIFSSGFAEMGEEGRALQNEISGLAKESDMVIIGPNCQGIANLKSKSITSFSTAFAEGELVNGSSAILSQSGAVAAMIYNMQKDDGVGVKYWVSTGNEADISIPRIVDYVLDDPDIKVIQLYMENIKDGNEIKDISTKSRELNIPILVLKPGKSEEGQRAAGSHTGALASEDIVIDKVLDHYGLVRVDDVNEMSSFSKVFRLSKRVRGKNVAILSNSGGLGVMMVDKCKEYGLNIVDFEEETVQRLSKILPVFASYENPIDVTAQLLNDKKLLSNALPILMEDSNVDIILFGMGIIGKGYDIEKITSEIIQAQRDGEKLISVAWVGSEKGITGKLNQNGVPAFEDPTMCIKAISKYANYCLRNKQHKTVPSQKENMYLNKQAFLEKVENSSGFLSEYDSKSVLSRHFPIGEVNLCANEEGIRKISEELRYPVVMKINSSEIQHKSEVGGVKLNIQSANELLGAYSEMLSNTRLPKVNEGFVVLIEEMVESGFEISLGLKKDPVFGPIIMVASGGIYIEVLKDFQLLIPPVTYEQAEKAVNALAMSPLLKGIRGKSKKDINELCHVIVRFSEFVLQNEKVLEEVDLNPIIVGEEGKGVKIVDALIKVVRNGGSNER
jgi:acyl-CoA synthetase (NDP forming)